MCVCVCVCVCVCMFDGPVEPGDGRLGRFLWRTAVLREAAAATAQQHERQNDGEEHRRDQRYRHLQHLGKEKGDAGRETCGRVRVICACEVWAIEVWV